MAENKDLFAPPTPEEMNMFAPPTKEELGGEQSKPQGDYGNFIQNIKDFGTGAKQGVSMGFADELAGAGEAGIDMLRKITRGEPVDWKQIKEVYRKAQESEQKGYEQAQERSPYLTGTGELLGGIGGAVATGGLGGEALVAKTGIKGLSKEAMKALAKEELGKTAINSGIGAAGGGTIGATTSDDSLSGGLKGAGLGALAGLQTTRLGRALSKKAAIDAAASLPVGAAMGAGYSKGQLDQEGGLSQIGSDIAHGAETAGLIGGAASLGMGLAGAAKSKLAYNPKDDSPFTRQMKLAYEKGEEGKGFSGEKNKLDILRSGTKTAEDLGGGVNAARKELGENIGNIVDNSPAVDNIPADKMSEFSDLSSFLGENTNYLGKKETEKAVQILKNPEMASPSDLFDLKRKIDGALNIAEGSEKAPLLKGKAALNDVIELNAPGYKEAAGKYGEFKGATTDTLGRFGESEVKGINTQTGSDLVDAIEGMKNIIKKSSVQTESGMVPFEVKNQLVDKLREIGSTPEGKALLDKNGLNADEVFAKLTKAADLRTLYGNMNRVTEEAQKMTGIIPALKSFSKSTVLKVPYTAGKFGNIYNMGKEQLLKGANKLKSVPGLEGVGQKLEQAVINDDITAKNAAIFVIMQKPSAKQHFEEAQ